jgi:tRNA nucleotidyltransferase/poly(A) polymerase
MNQEERILKKLADQPALFFINDFLTEHPEAELFLVGGAVRDAILNRSMNEIDFDFVIRGLEPEKIENWFGSFGELNLVGQHFGVYKFMPTGFTPKQIDFIDIALPRTEKVANGSLGGYKDFDIQSDKDLSIEDDLSRRDFTINAIAFNLRTKELIDPFNGQIDIETKTLRAVGDPEKRFKEDLSRILRGIRFAAELHFDIEDETSQAIREDLHKLNVQREQNGQLVYVIPREVIGSELAKALNRNPVRAINECLRHGVLHELFPEVTRMMEVDFHYLDPLKEVRAGEITVTVALLLRCLNPEELGQALNFSGLGSLPKGTVKRVEPTDIKTIVARLQTGPTLEEVSTMRGSQFERHFMNGRGPILNRCLELIGKGDIAQAARDRRRDIEARWLVDGDEKIAPLLSGNDILSHGIEAGPKIRQYLDLLRDQQLDGNLMSRDQALTWLNQELKN